MNPLWYLAVAVPLALVGAGSAILEEAAPTSPQPGPVEDGGPPGEAKGVSQEFDLLTTYQGSIEFEILRGTEGVVSALVAPAQDAVRPERPICVTLERGDEVIQRVGQCGMNVVLQTSVQFDEEDLLGRDASELEPGTYRLSYNAEPQPAILVLAFQPA